ncbi:MAG: sigma-70 family RNA polymerase sigma factor [Clostridia bacterium]|nr:sigma-70 family RNA polymerase sigma factor [Clostridia bacterium]MCR4906983.1 sigma-70 family RNA polymerase sigma factor [Clostridiales bacterium]
MAQNDRISPEVRDALRRAAEGDREAEERLVEWNQGLVTSVAARFRGRGADFEDLVQIGSIGLLKAIRSFDLDRGFAFSTYAVPLIIGEIRRFLRDDGMVKVGRGQKRTGALLMKEREAWIAEHGEEPRLNVLAERVGITPEEAAAALDAASPVRSLSESIGEDDFSLEDVIPAEDDEIGRMIENLALTETIRRLPPLWRQIIVLRYFKEYSQQQTADVLGLTQVKISREEKKIFAELRGRLA